MTLVVGHSFEEVPVLRVDHVDGTFALMADCVGRDADVELVNRFLAHLGDSELFDRDAAGLRL